ncbi:hypothetical protein [Azotobacter vinelandii]|uniref:hypothetical protein n=1 Tax=Azotobacter vinelandii TaxID=354 RepID=UPI0012E8F65F|nr:hypothetical protein [Azotobacter vinelandii]
MKAVGKEIIHKRQSELSGGPGLPEGFALDGVMEACGNLGEGNLLRRSLSEKKSHVALCDEDFRFCNGAVSCLE